MSKYRVYVGTYTRGTDSKGLYVLEYDCAEGTLTEISAAGGFENPSFMAFYGDNAYAISESGSSGISSGSKKPFMLSR